MTLQHRKILLGITGSIAAYKACELVRLLRRNGAEVQVVMTESAQEFVGAITLEALSGQPVRSNLFDREAESAMSHIELARWADTILIAPTSANYLARLALGLADDLLGALCLATQAPIMLAPAMNVGMWENPVTQSHVATLRERGITVLEPAIGEQACGETGAGRLLEPEALLETLLNQEVRQELHGIHALVTAGPTREMIDPARYISNFSSGRLGCEITRALLDCGAKVTLICGPLAMTPPAEAQVIPVVSAEEMLAAVQKHVGDCELVIAAAAVADWRPRRMSQEKIRKTDYSASLVLEPTVDILATLGAQTPRPYLVGFAAETEDLIQNARAKLLAKGADLMIANQIGDGKGFGEVESHLDIVSATDVTSLGPASKKTLARQLVAHIATQFTPASSVIDFACAYDKNKAAQ